MGGERRWLIGCVRRAFNARLLATLLTLHLTPHFSSCVCWRGMYRCGDGPWEGEVFAAACRLSYHGLALKATEGGPCGLMMSCLASSTPAKYTTYSSVSPAGSAYSQSAADPWFQWLEAQLAPGNNPKVRIKIQANCRRVSSIYALYVCM